MRRRRTADQTARLPREADRDLAIGQAVYDICQMYAIAETTNYRRRRHYEPDQVGAVRRCRERKLEVDRLKTLVAESLLDRRTRQDTAKKSGEPDQLRAVADHLNER
jgi:hypothetical protein